MKTIIDMVCIPFQMIELTSPALKAEKRRWDDRTRSFFRSRSPNPASFRSKPIPNFSNSTITREEFICNSEWKSEWGTRRSRSSTTHRGVWWWRGPTERVSRCGRTDVEFPHLRQSESLIERLAKSQRGLHADGAQSAQTEVAVANCSPFLMDFDLTGSAAAAAPHESVNYFRTVCVQKRVRQRLETRQRTSPDSLRRQWISKSVGPNFKYISMHKMLRFDTNTSQEWTIAITLHSNSHIILFPLSNDLLEPKMCSIKKSVYGHRLLIGPASTSHQWEAVPQQWPIELMTLVWKFLFEKRQWREWHLMQYQRCNTTARNYTSSFVITSHGMRTDVFSRQIWLMTRRSADHR